MSAYMLAKGLLFSWDTVTCNGSHSFIVQMPSFSFKNKWQVFKSVKQLCFPNDLPTM